MTVAVVVLAIVLAAALGAVVYLLRRQQSALDAEVAAGKKDVADELAIQEANRERDEAMTARAVAEKEAADARAELKDTQRALNEALEEKAHETVESIRSAPTDAAALAGLRRLLQATARGEAVPGGEPTAGGDHGDA